MPTSIHISWPASPSQEGVTRYQVFESKNGSPLAYKTEVLPPLTELTIMNPTPGNYAWAVKAENFVGSSALSASASGPVIPSVPPAPTVVVTVS